MSDLSTTSTSDETSGLNFDRLSSSTTTKTPDLTTMRVQKGAKTALTQRDLYAAQLSSRYRSDKISIGYELAFSIPLDAAGLFPTQPGSPC